MKISQWILAIALLVLIIPADAKKLYKYQDEHGLWHYTDKPPETNQPVEVEQLSISRKASKVAVRNRGSQTEPVFHIVNGYRGPVEVEAWLTKHRNITAYPSLPARFVIPAASDTQIFRLRPTQKRWGFAYQSEYRIVMGDPKAEHRPSKPYRPPYQSGKSFRISQAFNGSYSHTHPQSQYAVDIAMPEGTPIHAARAGVVMDIANDFFRGGTDSDKYISRANLIRILHDDGTMAVYAHLQLETAQVSPGLRVSGGQFIAKSGNTGFSTGPHLHFVIQKNTGMNLVSVPFQFENEQGQGVTPQRGMVLTVY